MKKILFIFIIFFSCKSKEKTEILSRRYFDEGTKYQSDNNQDSAIFFFKKSLDINPENTESYESLIKIYLNNDKPEKSFEILNKAPDNIKNSTSILIFKGMTLEKVGKLDEALELYKFAFENINKEDIENKDDVIVTVGYLLLQTIIGEKKEALLEINRLKKRDITNFEMQYIKSIEPHIQKYNGGGYSKIMDD